MFDFEIHKIPQHEYRYKISATAFISFISSTKDHVAYLFLVARPVSIYLNIAVMLYVGWTNCISLIELGGQSKHCLYLGTRKYMQPEKHRPRSGWAEHCFMISFKAHKVNTLHVGTRTMIQKSCWLLSQTTAIETISLCSMLEFLNPTRPSPGTKTTTIKVKQTPLPRASTYVGMCVYRVNNTGSSRKMRSFWNSGFVQDLFV